VSFYAPDSVWDVSAMGMGVYEGVTVIRRELEQWINAYQQFEIEVEEVRDLGNGVILSVTHQGGHPLGSSGYLQMRFATVTVWRGGMIARVTPYPDVDQARAAAERLAEERADA
jgi:ketosteroid isomerase-like protein